MSEVSRLHLHDHEEDVLHQHLQQQQQRQQTLTLPSDSLPSYWSNHNDLEFYPSAPEFDPSDVFFTDPILSTNGPHFMHRRNQVNFVMDLFDQRVQESQVIIHDDNELESGSLNDSDFGVVHVNYEIGMDELELDLDLDLGLGLEFGGLRRPSTRFVVENEIDINNSVYFNDDIDHDEDFFVDGMVSGLGYDEAGTTGQIFGNGIHVDFHSDSEYEDADERERVRVVDLHLGDEYVNDDIDDASISIPLCWDSLQLEDHMESIEDFEWEEVGVGIHDREAFNMFVDADNDDPNPTTPIIEDVISNDRVRGASGNLEWEVLLNSRNLETNHDLDNNNSVPYFGDHEDYLYNDDDYDLLFGQFVEPENALTGRPPASRSVVENLSTVVLTGKDVENKNALCAVCTDEMSVGDKAKELPCTHRYHADCILPWLGIRNTCPVCRHELPTDDPAYERRRSQRSSHGM